MHVSRGPGSPDGTLDSNRSLCALVSHRHSGTIAAELRDSGIRFLTRYGAVRHFPIREPGSGACVPVGLDDLARHVLYYSTV